VKVVVLGGYGNFGARICRALARDASIELVVAGRDAARAREFARPLEAAHMRLDASGASFAGELRRLGAQLVIHTAGPFQGQDYAVARACATAGAHYIDLADGRRFVCDFTAGVDKLFRESGRTAITGASTVPALSSAVVDAAQSRFDSIASIDLCIAPAQRAPRGVATLEGVLSYCGAPIQVWRDGRWQLLDGWADPMPVRFARLKPRRGALCDIPDLELFPGRYPGVRNVMFRAALEVSMTQSVFAMIARLRKRGWIAQPQALGALLHRSGRLVDWLGTPDGGMAVRVQGHAQGHEEAIAWHITAGGHHGPEIPCMAAILLARKLAGGVPLPVGAMPCMGLLTLEEFAPEFARWGMMTEWMREPAHGA
jgi:saccharopine dehydrogenase-like NADP-dependent oxidoreductase